MTVDSPRSHIHKKLSQNVLLARPSSRADTALVNSSGKRKKGREQIKKKGHESEVGQTGTVTQSISLLHGHSHHKPNISPLLYLLLTEKT